MRPDHNGRACGAWARVRGVVNPARKVAIFLAGIWILYAAMTYESAVIERTRGTVGFFASFLGLILGLPLLVHLCIAEGRARRNGPKA